MYVVGCRASEWLCMTFVRVCACRCVRAIFFRNKDLPASPAALLFLEFVCACLYTEVRDYARVSVCACSERLRNRAFTNHLSRVNSAATRCNTLQHTATHCNTLQHTATHCNTLQHTATHCVRPAPLHSQQRYNKLQHTATHCNTQQHTTRHYKTLRHTVCAKRVLCSVVVFVEV